MKMMMSIKKDKFALVWIGLALIAGFLLYSTVKILIPISTNDPDYAAIEATLQKYAFLRVEVQYTLDDAQLSQILANDLRGGLVDAHFLKLVQYIKGNPNLKLWQVGFLDVIQARTAFDRKAKQLYEAALARGEIQPPAKLTYDSSENPVSIDIKGTDKDPRKYISQPNLREVPEIVAMEKEAQFSAFLPVPRTTELQPVKLEIISVHTVGDFGIARVKWEYGMEEDIFVKKGGNWYLAGTTLTESHGG